MVMVVQKMSIVGREDSESFLPRVDHTVSAPDKKGCCFQGRMGRVGWCWGRKLEDVELSPCMSEGQGLTANAEKGRMEERHYGFRHFNVYKADSPRLMGVNPASSSAAATLLPLQPPCR